MSLIPLAACADEPPSLVGRKAALLGWAQTIGHSTPSGVVLSAERFWSALEACGASEQAHYLQGSALRLDPRHTLDTAASIVEAMRSPALEAMAHAEADVAFARLDAPRIVCRSSSAMEDGRSAAFPGVFASFLNLCSPQELGQAIADCWRSAFSVTAVQYLLRMRAEPVDFSLALLLQVQIEAAWYGLYVSVDPVSGDAEPLADLTDAGPDALVGGCAAKIQTRRSHGHWVGTDGLPHLGISLEKVHRAAEDLRAHLQAEVDIEFAVLNHSGEPVVLQCRPLTHIPGQQSGRSHGTGTGAGRLVGRPCSAGRVVGLASGGGAPGGGGRIAVVDQLTTADYGIVFRHGGIVMEHDASPLSHISILCREIGVPFVCGVEDARAQLVGHWVAIDGRSGEIEVVEQPAMASETAHQAAAPAVAATLSAVELLLQLLAEGRPGRDPTTEVERIARRYGRALGTADSIRLVSNAVTSAEIERLQPLAAELFGPDFSITHFLSALGRSGLNRSK
ncbi:MAG: pyruvate, water dikinase [Acidimicrobiaceae bacterium]|nr:pyruvate, water dikinase [Acidimicrobiaceae bacterium]